jgi:peptidoglycan-associated lipoprotein
METTAMLPAFRRFVALSLLIVAMALPLAACGKNKHSLDHGLPPAQTEISPLDDIYGGTPIPGMAAPGSQADLASMAGDRVFFDTNRSDLLPESRGVLEAQAAWLQSYPQLMVTIEGHCDERGTREYNLALGERRAQSVRDYLVSMGVDASRLTTVSYGKENPEAVGSTPEAWALNRRSVTRVE